MKRKLMQLVAVLGLVAVLCACSKKDDKPFGEQVRQLDMVSVLEPFQPEENPGGYSEIYRVWFRQPVDHNNPQTGTFTQQALLYYLGADRPTVMYTCGYDITDKYTRLRYHSLAKNLKANMVVVEHRYYGESKVEGDPRWDYLTLEQAAADHDAIFQALKPLLPGKWVSTGVSKDGQTSLFFRYFYPNDMDVTTLFCAPMLVSFADTSLEKYMQESCRTPEERQAVSAIIRRLLKGGEQGLYAKASKMVSEKYPDYTFDFTEYVVACMEYPFGIYSYAEEELLPPETSDEDLLERVAVDWVQGVIEDELGDMFYSCNIQQAKQMGSYLYTGKAYADLLEGTSFDSAKIPRIIYPLKEEDQWLYDTYDNTVCQDIVNRFLPETTLPILMVYSKNDPWTGCKPEKVNEPYVKVLVNPIGIHGQDLNVPEHYAPETVQEIVNFIQSWF
ncbi:MAG: hypothetical protein J5835_05535 [Bacteroidales bacterium]|nr:hypothetical protein [Bacteroidales bacterium]